MVPKISIGLPVYNAANFVDRAIASILAQSEKNWELIVVDDGSSDESLMVVQSFNDNRIKIFQDGENRGLANRLNQITSLAKAPYLARMDADDLMHPERLALQLGYLIENPHIDVVGSGVYTIDKHDNAYGYRKTRIPTSIDQALRGGVFIHPTIMGRSRWFQKFPYDEIYGRAEDVDLWLRSLPYSNFAVIDQPLLFYREMGLPYLKKYLLSSKEVRLIIRQQGKEKLGRMGTLRALRNTYLKDVIYQVTSRIGKEDALLLRRNRSLDLAEQADAAEILKYIRQFLSTDSATQENGNS